MRILFLGDVVGKGARRLIRRELRGMRRRLGVDLAIANGENAAGGKGIDPDSLDELLDAGIDVVTSGNHVWQHKSLLPVVDREPRLLRPFNFPPGSPGRGWSIVASEQGTRVGVLNLIGRVFLGSYDCPFRAADIALNELQESGAQVVIVDMHAEATSEKAAMGWYLDGRVAAVLGSHTHVQTADERLLPKGTAYQTDVGMCGPRDSIIGMRREEVIHRFLTQMPVRFDVAKGDLLLQGALVEVDEVTGRAQRIERIQEHHEPC